MGTNILPVSQVVDKCQPLFFTVMASEDCIYLIDFT